MKILIAEDDPNILDGLSEIFEAEGYQTILAADGQQAIEKFKTEQPDFVCLDIMMPGKSGYDVCREIRKNDSHVPVIFLSAKSEEIDKVLGLELGAADLFMGAQHPRPRIGSTHTCRSLVRLDSYGGICCDAA